MERLPVVVCEITCVTCSQRRLFSHDRDRSGDQKYSLQGENHHGYYYTIEADHGSTAAATEGTKC